ncbi:HAD-IA family hydrolase [Roseibacterium sp. SDUM158017]|uniref:HAD-IA family hydrolase n=1 Tax=Roseicyclus salinarum TaxID=3036773 RepID=UPI00241581FA|nr:HAD-IA family hydrolase [Roseibacterium sp. SDUM158017]MDG4650234.1 HAD-IA family hydrolase [Roseibacterium sp. SDUM158017]
MSVLRLVVFDVDGTLVDSQAHIWAAMERAFASIGHSPPPRPSVLGIVGLSLPVAMARLAPDMPDRIEDLVAAYKAAFAALRQDDDGALLSPLFPGARDCLEALAADPWTLLGIATGKSRRGLDHLFELHGFGGLFQTVQVADDHPSKPHPAMLEACLRETGADEARSVIVGDTTFDMEMGRAAGFRTVGVNWGYHAADALRAAGADTLIGEFSALPSAIETVLQGP